MCRPLIKGMTARLLLGAVLGLSPIAGYPLGLGKLKVNSALNEPLKAEIEFTSIADNERRGLNVALAPRADFEAAGAERLPFLSNIKFQVVQRPDGRYYLDLKTEQPIEEPFLHLLLQLEWPGGRLVREYTALVDPPAYMISKPAAVDAPATAAAPAMPITPAVPIPTPAPTPFVETVPPPTAAEPAPPAVAQAPVAEPAAPATPAPAPAPLAEVTPAPASEKAPEPPLQTEPATVAAAPAPTEVKPEPQPQAVAAPEAPVAPPSQASAPAMIGPNEFVVQSGDNLWTIAQAVNPDRQLTTEQVVLAIYKSNRDAFFRDNVNNLRSGKVLKIPEREVIEQIATADARREFKAQYDVWQEYKLKLAAGGRTLKVDDSAAAPADAAAAKPETAPQEATKKADAKPGKPSDEPLKIVRTQDQKAGKKGAEAEAPKDVEKRERAALADRATTLEESLESKQMENRELSEKIGQVRAQIKSEKRLMELESQALAKQTEPKTETKPAAKAAEAAKSEPAKPIEAPKVAEAPKPAEAAVPKTVPQEPTPAPKAAPKPAVPAPAPVEDKGFLASLLDDLFSGSVLPIVGGVLALVGGVILIVYLRRRQRSIAEFEESILASDAIANNDAPTGSADNTTGQAATTGDTSFLSDFSKAGMGHMQTDEVDPIAEAEVYLAYGRDETAEEILKEAIVKNPERQELKQKLLEIYHQRNDVNAFETLAEELYAALGGRGGKMWDKIEEMGRKLNPENPMFRGGAPAARRATDKTERPAEAAPAGEGFSAPTMIATGAAAASAPTQVVEKDSGGIDFDLSSPAPATGEPSFDFDISESAPAAKTQVASADDLSSLDFGAELGSDAVSENVISFESSKPEPAANAGGSPAPAAEDEIKWDLEAPVVEAAAAESESAGSPAGSDQEAHWDETATKLDLAKAYIDMGDADGARSILDEVLAEGNDQQKKQAAELAAQIA